MEPEVSACSRAESACKEPTTSECTGRIQQTGKAKRLYSFPCISPTRAHWPTNTVTLHSARGIYTTSLMQSQYTLSKRFTISSQQIPTFTQHHTYCTEPVREANILHRSIPSRHTILHVCRKNLRVQSLYLKAYVQCIPPCTVTHMIVWYVNQYLSIGHEPTSHVLLQSCEGIL